LVKASVGNGVLHLELISWSRWLALSRGLDIPLPCIKTTAAGAPGLRKFRWIDLRLGGTRVPGTLAAVRFWMGYPRRWGFLHLRRSSKEVRSSNCRTIAMMPSWSRSTTSQGCSR